MSQKPNQKSKSASAQRSVKLQKVLADLGFASRRHAEQWISAGRVKVDGELATLGDRVLSSQVIELDGKEIKKPRTRSPIPRILLMNKAAGVEVSRRPASGRPTVFEGLPKLHRERWVSVGRLDVSTSGLILFSNDGEVANRLTHPSAEIDREYAVRVKGLIDDETIGRLLKGVKVDGEELAFSDIQHYDGRGSNHWYHVCLMQGRYREVRRLFESQNLLVSRLKRVRFGPFFLPSFLGSGRVMEVHPDEVKAICSMLDYSIAGSRKYKISSLIKKRSVLLQYPNLDLPEWSHGRNSN